MTVNGELIDVEDGWRRFQAERSDILVRSEGDTVAFKDFETLVDLSGLDDDNEIPGAGDMMDAAIRALAEEKHGDNVPWSVSDT